MAICANCGREATCTEERITSDLTAAFCSPSCFRAFKAKYSSTQQASSGNTTTSGGDNSATGAAAGTAAAVGAGLAAAGIGAAIGGLGAAAKGVGAMAEGLGKGAGAAAEGMGKMVGAMGSEIGGSIIAARGQTKNAEQRILEVRAFKFSEDPDTYKKQILEMYELATDKSPIFQERFVSKEAKKKLIKELDMLAIRDGAMYANFAALHQQLKKKKFLFF